MLQDMRFKILLFFLSLAALGGSLLTAWWFYDQVDQPEREARQQLREREKNKNLANLPDPAQPTYLKARQSLLEGDLDAAIDHFNRLIRIYPDSPRAREARRILGEINLDRLFARAPLPGKREYEVKRGDSLLKLEQASLTTIAYLMRANHMTSLVLQPGDRIAYQSLQFEIKVSRGQQTLTLYKKPAAEGAPPVFFKEYQLLGMSLPNNAKIKTQIQQKMAWVGDKRVQPTDPLYVAARKSLQTTSRPGRPGILLTAPEAREKTVEDPVRRPTLYLSEADLEELSVIIRPGTPFEVGA